jgi:hypothetical protein
MPDTLGRRSSTLLRRVGISRLSDRLGSAGCNFLTVLSSSPTAQRALSASLIAKCASSSETGHEAREEGSLIHLMEYALFAGNPPYSNLPYSFVSVTVAQLCRGMMGRPLR